MKDFYNDDEMGDWIDDKSENFYGCVKQLLGNDVLSLCIAEALAQSRIDIDMASEFFDAFNLDDSDAYCFLYDHNFFDTSNRRMEKQIEELWDKYQIGRMESAADSAADDIYLED